jgi:HEAT repeat protein
MEWVKQLPTWVKGTIAFFTTVIGFIVLFLNNLYLSITVSIATVLIAAFTFCAYVAFSKKQSEFLSGRSVYRFPQYRRFAMAGLLIVPLISATLIAVEKTRTIAVIAFVGTATPVWTITPPPIPIDLISEEYQKASMRYDLVVQNNSRTQQILTKIGVISHVTGGDFTCYAGSGPLISAEHYIVRFHVADAETSQTLEPPLTILPNDVVRFTVSLVPSALGACSHWLSDIALFIENANGVRAQTKTQSIDGKDIRALSLINYSHEELMDIAKNSPDAISRAGSIDQLSENEFGFANTFATTPSAILSADETDALYALFSEALQDISPTVRYSAVNALAYLGNTDAVPKIILILQHDEIVYARSAAADALGRLGDRQAVEPLGLALLNDPENDVQFNAAEALGMIDDPKGETYLIEAWTHGAASNVVSVIAGSLIQLKSTKAIPLLIAEIRKEGDDEHRLTIIRKLRGSEPSYILAFIPTLVDLLTHDSSEYVRNTVAFEIRFAPTQEELISALGQSAMADPSSKVRLTAVESLSEIGTSAAIEQLKNIAASQIGDVKKAAEDALEALGQR